MRQPGMKDILQRLTQLSNVTISIVSGRHLDDIKQRVNIPGVIHCGGVNVLSKYYPFK